jgi:HSP20 family protein
MAAQGERPEAGRRKDFIFIFIEFHRCPSYTVSVLRSGARRGLETCRAAPTLRSGTRGFRRSFRGKPGGPKTKHGGRLACRIANNLEAAGSPAAIATSWRLPMNVVPYDPLDLVEGVMKSVLRPTFDAAREFHPNGGAVRTIPVDVAEDDQRYYVWADLPGVRKEDVDVSVLGNQVTLAARVHRTKAVDQGQGKETILRKERLSGALLRTIEFAGEIDDTQASAEYRDGVLTLTLPKKASSQVKRLAIN